MHEANVRQVMEMQEQAYKERVGQAFGDFVVTNVWYDWDRRTQMWSVMCRECKDETIVPGTIGRDWARGNGRTTKCKKCKEKQKEKQKEIAKKERKNRLLQQESELDSFIGQAENGWIFTARAGTVFTAICETCGRTRKVKFSEAKTISECAHPNDFSKPEYIGKRYGHLVVLEYLGGNFKVRCDCGFEKLVKCSAIENRKTTTCGRLECNYHVKELDYLGKHGELVRAKGEKAEKDIQRWLERLGYSVERTPMSGDYGVDLIVIGRDGSRVAIQIKNNAATKSETNVHAVEEVFAGGHYYDCDKFAVVSYTGYTENARKMANKLGVMLLTERCELYKQDEYFNKNIKHLWVVNGKTEPMVETFRREGWGKVSEKYIGMTYVQVCEEKEKQEKRKLELELIKQSGLTPEAVYNRIKRLGMSFEQAISLPKQQGQKLGTC